MIDIIHKLIGLMSMIVILLLIGLFIVLLLWILIFYTDRYKFTKLKFWVKENKSTVMSIIGGFLGFAMVVLQAQIMSQQLQIEENQAISQIVSNIDYNKPISIQFAISRLVEHGYKGYKVIFSLSDVEDFKIKTTVLSIASSLALQDKWSDVVKAEILKRDIVFFERLYQGEYIPLTIEEDEGKNKFVKNFIHLLAETIRADKHIIPDKRKLLMAFLNYEFINNCKPVSRDVLNEINFYEVIRQNTDEKTLSTLTGEKLLPLGIISEKAVTEILTEYYKRLSVDAFRILHYSENKRLIEDLNQILSYLVKNPSRNFYNTESGQIGSNYYGYLFMIYKPMTVAEGFMVDQNYLKEFLSTNKPSPLRPYLEFKLQNTNK